jgi:molecular chaperone Hsp33
MTATTLYTAVDEAATFRVRMVDLTSVAKHVAEVHKLSPLATHAMARALGCAALYPFSAKHLDRVSLQFTGEGPLKMLMVDVRILDDQRLGVRGLANRPQAWAWGIHPRSDEIGAGLLPGGGLTVLLQEPSGKATRGQVDLVNGEIDDDFAAYFRDSEQLPTDVQVRVRLDDDGMQRCVCRMVQALPGLSSLPSLPPINLDIDVVTQMEQVVGTPMSVWKASATQQVEFFCSCSRERALAGIEMLDRDTLIDMIVVDKGASVTCDFCTSHYAFSADDLVAILDTKDKEPSLPS